MLSLRHEFLFFPFGSLVRYALEGLRDAGGTKPAGAEAADVGFAVVDEGFVVAEGGEVVGGWGWGVVGGVLVGGMLWIGVRAGGGGVVVGCREGHLFGVIGLMGGGGGEGWTYGGGVEVGKGEHCCEWESRKMELLLWNMVKLSSEGSFECSVHFAGFG